MPSCAAHASAGYVQISASVGCRCGMRMNCSTVAPKFIATMTSWISSDACGPMTAAPRMRPSSRVGHHLHEALGLGQALRFAVLGEIVASAHVRDSVALQILLARADGGDLRIGEDRVRCQRAIIGTLVALQAGVARRDFALVDRDVDEHVFAGHVADRVDLRIARAQRRRRRCRSARSNVTPARLETETRRRSAYAPERIEDLVGRDFALDASCR